MRAFVRASRSGESTFQSSGTVNVVLLTVYLLNFFANSLMTSSLNGLIVMCFFETEIPMMYALPWRSIGWFQAITNSRSGYFSIMVEKINFAVFLVTGSKPLKNSAGVATLLEDVEPRTYITNALACAWLNPYFSRR